MVSGLEEVLGVKLPENLESPEARQILVRSMVYTYLCALSAQLCLCLILYGGGCVSVSCRVCVLIDGSNLLGLV
jgi:hypothetical protein